MNESEIKLNQKNRKKFDFFNQEDRQTLKLICKLEKNNDPYDLRKLIEIRKIQGNQEHLKRLQKIKEKSILKQNDRIL